MDPIGAALSFVAARGVVGLLLVTLCERIVPIVPSYAVLVAIGIAAAHGHWSVHTAVVTSTAGGLTGGLLFYAFGAAFAARRSLAPGRNAALARTATRAMRVFGASPHGVGRLVTRFRAHEHVYAFCSQLIPGVRLLAPGVAGLLRLEVGGFLTCTALGIALWNMLFIGIGYVAARAAAGVTASTLALRTVVVLVVGECLVVIAWRAAAARRRVREVGTTESTDRRRRHGVE